MQLTQTKPVPFFLVTGFLGSGKTTLLKRILHRHADAQKIAVIQNEFAPGNVDAKELRATGKSFHMMEINRGSVFCVCLLSDFTQMLKEVVDTHQPDAIFLEATGLADPIAIAELLESPDIRDRLFLKHIWCIVDASTFLKAEYAFNRLSRQVRIADSVLINKSDLSENLNRVESRIRQLNPFAESLHCTHCDISLDRLFDSGGSAPVAIRSKVENADFESCGRPLIQSAVLKSTRKISEDHLTGFLKNIEAGTIRLKGFVNLKNNRVVQVQSCFGQTRTALVNDYSGPSELIVLGENLNAAKMRNELFSATDS